VKRYECTLCGTVHYINGSLFMEHIRYKSERGIWDAPPPPPIKLDNETIRGAIVGAWKSILGDPKRLL
jgi:hypothetical protein